MALLPGCAAPPSQQRSDAPRLQYDIPGHPQSFSSAVVPGGIYYAANVSDHRRVSEVINVKVTRWATFTKPMHIANAKAYVGVRLAGDGYRIVPLQDMQRLEFVDAANVRLTTAGGVIDGIKAVQLLACPAELPAPTRADCLYAKEGDPHRGGSDFYRQLSFEDPGAGSNVFWSSVGLRNGRPTGNYATGSDQAALAAAYAAAEGHLAKRLADDKNRSKIDAEAKQRAAEAFIANAKPGTTMFCVSNMLLRAGNPISSLTYRCDQGGIEHTGLRTLLERHWWIASEHRTPTAAVGGGYSMEISLTMVKH